MSTRFEDLIGGDARAFEDVCGERSRRYVREGLPTTRVDGAVAIAEAADGARLALDRDGVSHWIAPGRCGLEAVGADGVVRSSRLPNAAATADSTAPKGDATWQAWLEYDLADGGRIRVEDPLFVAEVDGGARRVTAVGAGPVVVPAGFVAARWQARRGRPHFRT